MSKINDVLTEIGLLGNISSDQTVQINEMNPTLNSKETGLPIGGIKYRIKEFQDKKLYHGAWVKYVVHNTNNEIPIVISPNAYPEKEAQDQFNELNSKLKKAILLFVSLNNNTLLDYWENGRTFTDSQLKEWKQKIIKV